MKKIFKTILSFAPMVILLGAMVAALSSCSAVKSAAADKNAQLIAIDAGIADDFINVNILKTIPTATREVIEYTTGEYLIRIRKDKAEGFIPQAQSDNFSQFGGTDVSGGSAPIQFNCRRKAEGKKGITYVLESQHGKKNYTLTIVANYNGAARITVQEGIYSKVEYYGDITVPENM